jgi:hypothetical protein
MDAVHASSIDLAVVIFRGLVLVIAALGGCMSIYLGWKLYKDGLLSNVDGSFKSNNGWKISLSSAGPGVFFAAFGMWLLVTLVNREISIDESALPTSNSVLSNENSVHKSVDLFRAFGYQEISDQQPPPSGLPAKCVIISRQIRMFGGDSLRGERAKSGLTDALFFLDKLDESKMSGQEVARLENTRDTIELMRDSTGDWSLQ